MSAACLPEHELHFHKKSGEESNNRYNAFTYYATHIDTDLRPYHWYKHHVLTGAIEHQLPNSYLEKISRIVSIPDPHLGRHKREMMIYTNYSK
jgi:hypothetical protein